MEHDVYIAIGSNLGDKASTIFSAVGAIDELESTGVVRLSTLLETDPVGPGEQDTYLNAAAHLRTALSARDLLDALLAIESAHGRDRAAEARWGPRTLDLDILVYADRSIDEDGLTIPHPRLHERAFVLVPLVEIAPDLTIPGRNETPAQLLMKLTPAR